MAITVNASAPAESTDRVLITGVVNLGVVALNPTLSELKEMGRNYKEEPEYFSTNAKSQQKQLQLDIWLSGEVNLFGEKEPVTVLDKVTFWLENSTSRGIYLDKFGKFGKDQSKLDASSARLAYNGEIDLIQFLKSLCNVRKDQEISLDTVKAMVSTGDTKELRELFAQTTQNQVRILAGVKDGKYQTLFGRHFDYAGGTDNAYLHKTVVRQQGGAYPLSGYFGPINVQDDTYKPNAYMARRYSLDEEQQFLSSIPQGTFGAPAGSANALPASFGQPAAGMPFTPAGGQFPQPHFGVQAKPAMVPIGASYEDDDLPF